MNTTLTRRLRALAVTGGLLAAAAASAAPAQAATTNGYSCRADALRVTLFSQRPIEPLAAGVEGSSCQNAEGGAPFAGDATLPSLLGLDAAYAYTRIKPSAQTAPAYQTAEAHSGLADARIDPNGTVLRVQAVQADSAATCKGGKVDFASSGRVAKLFLFGQEIPLNDGATQLITGLDGITKVLVHIQLNEEVRSGSSYTFRALHVTIPQDGSILDLVVGENKLSQLGAPCSDFTGTGGNPPGPGFDPSVRPVLGQPYGGGNVVALGDIPGYSGFKKAHSLCVSSKSFGRRIAIIGNNKRNNITGSKYEDRIFGYGARDRLNGGAGRDCIEAGNGSDIVNGGTSADALYGRGGRDYLDPGAGNDRVWGGSGPDTIVTGSGRDRISGGSGNDKMFTRDGRDRVNGGSGNDRIFTAARGRRDRVKCGKGRDVARVDSYDRVSKDCEVVIRVRGSRRHR